MSSSNDTTACLKKVILIFVSKSEAFTFDDDADEDVVDDLVPFFLRPTSSCTVDPGEFRNSCATKSRVACLRSAPLADKIKSPGCSAPSMAASDPGTMPKMTTPAGLFSILRPSP